METLRSLQGRNFLRNGVSCWHQRFEQPQRGDGENRDRNFHAEMVRLESATDKRDSDQISRLTRHCAFGCMLG